MRFLACLALGYIGLSDGIAAAQNQAPSEKYETCRVRMALDERTRGICLAADEVAQQAITWDAARHPRDHARAQLALGNALLVIGHIGSEEAAHRAAVEAYQAALSYYQLRETPTLRAGARLGMGGALISLARLGDPHANDEALRVLSSAIAETSRVRQPDVWAALHTSLGEAYFTRWQQTRDAVTIEQAYAAFDAALQVYGRPRLAERRVSVERRLEEMRREVADATPTQ